MKTSFLLFACAVAPLASLQAQSHSHSHSHAGHDHSNCGPHQKPAGFFNPEIEVALDLIGSYSRSADLWNITPRDVELIVHSDVGPYAQVYGIFNAGSELAATEELDPFELSRPTVEELAIVFDRLPWGLEFKAGQFFADFTAIGKLHGHELPFVDRPLSSEAILGGETKARGVELSWAPPKAKNLRFTAGLVNRIGAETPITGSLETSNEEETAFANRNNGPFRSLTGYGRIVSEWELTPATRMILGINYAQGSGEGTRQVASGDFRLAWQPDPQKDDLFETGGEVLWSEQRGRFSDEAFVAGGPMHGNASATGGYLFAQYRIGERWTPGVRVDYLRSDAYELGDQPERSRNDTWTSSAYLGFKVNDNNRLRFQVNHVDARHEIAAGRTSDWQFFAQWTFVWGAR